MRIVVFDLWGDFGHFKIPYTTSSPLTFPIPPKTALYGIIGAIMGYDKNEYLENFEQGNWSFSLSIKKPIQKMYIPENLINTKEVKLFARMPKNKSCRTQINFEFLKDPFYRIYVTSENNEELNKLKNLLEEHKSFYSISLGISECLANFKFVGVYNVEKQRSKEFVDISSIVPLYSLKDNLEINFLEDSKKYLKVHLPLEMKKDRELVKTGDFILEANGKTISAKVPEFLSIEELREKILLF